MLRNLLNSRGGIAAVEFALVAPVLLTIVAGLSDFPLALSDRMKIAGGVADGAGYAFNQGQDPLGTMSAVSDSDVQSRVRSSINLPNVQVKVSGPSLYCFSNSSTGNPPSTALTLAAVGSTCPNGNPPGTYIVISASYVYTPLLPFYSTLATTTLTESAAVRLY